LKKLVAIVCFFMRDMIRATGIDQLKGCIYNSNYYTFQNGGNVLTRNAIFHNFVEQIGGIGQKLVFAHAMTCAYPSKVLVSTIGANVLTQMGFSTADDYPTVKRVTKAETESHWLFSEQTYPHTRSSTEQTCCNSTTFSSHITGHKEVPQYQRIKYPLDPGVMPESAGASNSIAGYMPLRENLLSDGHFPIMRTNGDRHTKIRSARMSMLRPRSQIKQNCVPVDASRLSSTRPGSKGLRHHLSFLQPEIRVSKIADQDMSLFRGNSNLQYRKNKKNSQQMNQLRQGTSNYKKRPMNLGAITRISTDVNSSQRKICEKMGKTDVGLRKQENCFDQKFSRLREREEVQPTSLAAMVTLPNFYYRREWRYNTERWAIVSAFCHAIEQMCRANNQKITKRAQPKTRFHAALIPDISLADFLKRIGWFCDCPKECFVIALEYIHRTVKCRPDIQVNYNSAHNLISTCVQVSVKFYDDVVLNHKYYAQVVGLPAVEMTTLEKELLFLLSFDLFVLPEKYQQLRKQMLHDNKGLYKVDIKPELN